VSPDTGLTMRNKYKSLLMLACIFSYCSGGAVSRNIMKTQHSLLAASMLASPILCAFAQANTPIETITITGTKQTIATPFVASSTSVIDKQTIQSSGALSFTDLLRTIAGVNVGQSGPLGNLTELRFRGSESNHIMVLIDGVEINDAAQGGLVDLSHILLANIERIEVLRGPQSALWGSNAIAGVISIITKQASSNTVQPVLGLNIGDRQTYQANASVSQNLDALSYAISASTLKTDGENISRSGNEQDGYKNSNVMGRLDYAFNNEHSVNINARLVDYTSDFDASDFSTGLLADANNETQGDQLSVGASWHYTPQSAESLYAQLLSFQYSKQSNENFQDNVFSGKSEASKLRVLWNNQFNLAQNSYINLGLEGVEEDFEQKGPVVFGDPNQSQSTSSYSLVTNGQYALSNQVNLSASYRYDNNDTFDNASSFRLGSTYIFNRNWHAFASYGKAIKNPTFTERFGYFPSSFLGNPELRPEQQKSFEAGFEGNLENISLQVSWFKAKLENEILGFVYEPISAQFTAQNADVDSQREGIEFSLSGSFKDLDFKAQYSYLDASENNENELRRANHTGSTSISYRYNPQHLMYVQADYTGTRSDVFYPPFPSSSQVLALDAYWLVSANYQYTHNDSLKLNLRLSNIFNEQYEDVIGYSGESSRALLGLQYSW